MFSRLDTRRLVRLCALVVAAAATGSFFLFASGGALLVSEYSATRHSSPLAVSNNGPELALRLPLEGRPGITRRFDTIENPYGPGHRGVDFATTPGAPVYASASGVVTFAGPVAGRPLVVVEHENGWRTTYDPVEPAVAEGEAVGKGEKVGVALAGHPCPVEACLHWGLRDGETYRDPLQYVFLGPVRLLPNSST